MKQLELSNDQRQQCVDETHQIIHRARTLFRLSLPVIEIRFDLRGQASGMYVVRGLQRWIRYNPIIFAKYFSESLQQTIPHEVAHYICDRRYGLKNIRPHGQEWRQVMTALGATPQTRSTYDISDLPLRRQQRFTYRCGCNRHELSSTRHNRIHCDQIQYHCRRCGEILKYVGE